MCLSFVIQSFVHFLTQSFFLLQMLIKLKTLSLQLPCIRCLFFINIRLKNTFFLLFLHFFNFLRLNIELNLTRIFSTFLEFFFFFRILLSNNSNRRQKKIKIRRKYSKKDQRIQKKLKIIFVIF